VPVDEREHVWKKIKALDEEPCLINIAMGMAPIKSLQHSPKHSLKRFHQKRTTDVQMHV